MLGNQGKQLYINPLEDEQNAANYSLCASTLSRAFSASSKLDMRVAAEFDPDG